MKTRIFSAAVVIAIAVLLLVLQLYVPISFCIAAAVIGAIAVYEMLHGTGITGYKPLIILCMLFALLVPFIMCGYLPWSLAAAYTVFAVLVFAVGLKGHTAVTASALSAALAFSLLLPGAMGYLVRVTQYKAGGFFCILLVLCYSAVSDTGAYFTGVWFGRHKMAPIISPKKTWEGFAGGVVWGVAGTLIVCFIYQFALGYQVHFAAALIAAPVFIVLGVLGDLSASMVKRQCGVKDYGNLIPGHGGIMDRFDSIMMIVPVFYLYISQIDIIK